MAIVTRTYNPLPFQDLEPKRFEDLVRQLLYDFRSWRSLEATGRSGSDEGFDARGWETVIGSQEELESDDGITLEAESPITDRLWLIQCKREKTLGPAKMASHLAEIPEGEQVYGVVFAAACDLSKKTRDTLRSWAATRGVAEVHVWGKGELEDLLYQPKNDNLLFAYFGISLLLRKRQQSTAIKADIVMKRKLKKLFDKQFAHVLLRDPVDPAYPDFPGAKPDHWQIFEVSGISHRGLELTYPWSYAYMDPVTQEWDAANRLLSNGQEHLWEGKTVEESPRDVKLEAEAAAIWQAIPDGKQGWFKRSIAIPFSSIIAIDEMGDDCFRHAHIYVAKVKGKWPSKFYYVSLENNSRWESSVHVLNSKRIKKFPKDSRLDMPPTF